jgi:hypothetical protein
VEAIEWGGRFPIPGRRLDLDGASRSGRPISLQLSRGVGRGRVVVGMLALAGIVRVVCVAGFSRKMAECSRWAETRP